MRVPVFRKIADRISGNPRHKNPYVALYNWGEAPLHKDLDKIVAILRERNIRSEVSTNLNLFPKMEDVLLAGLDSVRISLSGARNETYGRTHVQGDIANVIANMRALRRIIDKHSLPTSVQVGFHIYRHNYPEDFILIGDLCKELNFLFQPTIASMSPLEITTKVAAGLIPAEVHDVNDLLVIPIQDYRTLLDEMRLGNESCYFKKSTTAINADASVALCCATYSSDHIISENFLSQSLDELDLAKRQAEFCGTCCSYNLDLLHTGKRGAKFLDAVSKVLGEDYRKFHDNYVAQGSFSKNGKIRHEGEWLTDQEACDRAQEYRQTCEFESAEALLTKVAITYPAHGYCWFQLAQLQEMRAATHLAAVFAAHSVYLGCDYYSDEAERMRSMLFASSLLEPSVTNVPHAANECCIRYFEANAKDAIGELARLMRYEGLEDYALALGQAEACYS